MTIDQLTRATPIADRLKALRSTRRAILHPLTNIINNGHFSFRCPVTESKTMDPFLQFRHDCKVAGEAAARAAMLPIVEAAIAVAEAELESV